MKLTISLAGTKGLCSKGVKCIRSQGHAGECYPKDVEGMKGGDTPNRSAMSA